MSPLQMPAEVRLPGDVRIPLSELDFTFVRSPGPGGQHVNTSSTRVELRFDVVHSPSLPEPLRRRAQERLGHRLTQAGHLIIASSRHRSQARNRQDCVARFAQVMTAALRPPPPPRRPTRPGRAAVARRLETKKRHSQKKHLRRPPGLD